MSNRREKLIPGTKFNKYTVLSFKEYGKKGAIYACQCECGHEQDVTGTDLRNDVKKQCNKCAIKIRKKSFHNNRI